MKHAKFIFYLNFLRGLRWILCSSDYCVIFCGVWVSLVCFAKFINVDFLHCSEVCLVCLCPQPLAHLLPFLYKVLATFCSLELSVFSEDSASRMLVTTSYLLTPASSVASLGRPSQVGKGLSASFLSHSLSPHQVAFPVLIALTSISEVLAHSFTCWFSICSLYSVWDQRLCLACPILWWQNLEFHLALHRSH